MSEDQFCHHRMTRDIRALYASAFCPLLNEGKAVKLNGL